MKFKMADDKNPWENAEQDEVHADSELLKDLEGLVWTLEAEKDFGSHGISVPIFDDETGYLCSNDGRLHAIDPETGKKLWEIDVRAGDSMFGVRFPLTIEDGIAYLSTSGDKGSVLHVIDVINRVKLADLVTNHSGWSLAVKDKTAYYGDNHNFIFGTNVETGKGWKVKGGGTSVWAKIEVAEGTAYAGVGVRLHAIKDGDELWKCDNLGLVHAKPLFHEGTVYVSISDQSFGSKPCYLSAVDAETGEQEWLKKCGRSMVGSPVIHENLVIASSVEGMCAYDLETGEKKWSSEYGDGEEGLIQHPVISNGVVYGALGDKALGVDAKTGERKLELRPEGVRGIHFTVSVHKDMLYFGSGDIVYAVRLGKNG